MTSWDAIEAILADPVAGPAELLAASERCLENWVEGRGEVPTAARREGFRLLALHAQGAKGEPSFNACRETCREIAYHYNLLNRAEAVAGRDRTRLMMGLVAKHLMLFVRGKMEVAGLGEFCCSSRALRGKDVRDIMTEVGG